MLNGASVNRVDKDHSGAISADELQSALSNGKSLSTPGSNIVSLVSRNV